MNNDDLERYIDLVHKRGKPTIAALTSWQTPATDYPVGASYGAAKIIRRRYQGMYMSYRSRGFDFVEFKRRVPITELKVGKQTWMVDDPWHFWNIADMAAKMHGRVLVGGLGLGLIVWELAANPKVTEIVVVERDADVIGLIRPLLPKTDIPITIIKTDVWRLFDDKTSRLDLYDCCFMDLWVTNSKDEGRNVFYQEVFPLALNIRETYECPMWALGFTGTNSILGDATSDVENSLWEEGENT